LGPHAANETKKTVNDQSYERKLAAILVADVVGYSRLMGVDEEGTLAELTSHLDEMIKPCITEHRGRLVKTMGDGLLIEFDSVVGSVHCAIAIQEAMQERNAGVGKSRRIEFRIGVNLGDVIARDGDIFGEGVNIAARLESLAETGSICISDMVYQGVRSKVDAQFEDLGLQHVKNIGDPVHAYLVRPGKRSEDAVSMAKEALALPDKPSIAVLPFDNISGDLEQEYFADGITEDIITELSKISGIFVIARHSVFVYKGRSITLRQVGQELGVRYVMEGSVRKSGQRLRISAQLIDAAKDHHLWAERYDRELEDIFAVQEEVARSVADALVVQLKPEEMQRLSMAPIDNVEAYELYLRTRVALWPPTRENTITARSAYQHLAAIEPTFAGGFAGESMTYSLAVVFGHSERPETDTRLAMERAKAAVVLNDNFAMTHSAQGLAYLAAGRHEEAIACVSRAVELQPGDADVQFFSALTNMFGARLDEAHAAAEAALRLDPQYTNGPYMNILGVIDFCTRRYEEAIAAFEKNLVRGGPIAWPAMAFRAAALHAAGRREEAEAVARSLRDNLPGFCISGYLFLRLFDDEEITSRIATILLAVGLPE